MSISYFLVCMECKDGVSLGKKQHRKYPIAEKRTLGFASLDFSLDVKDQPDGVLLNVECLDRFLMLHRTHELRVLPELAAKYSTDVAFPHSFPTVDDQGSEEYSRKVFLSTDLGDVDPEEDMANLSNDVIEKLKKF